MVRLNEGSLQSASVVAVESTGPAVSISRSPTAGQPGTYVVYFLPPECAAGPARPASLIASFDYLNFDPEDDPSATLKLLKVDIEAAPINW